MSMMLQPSLLLPFWLFFFYMCSLIRMMMTDCVYWLLFWFDSDNKPYPLGIFYNLDDVFENVRSRVHYAPFVCRYRLFQFHLGNTMSIYYDDNKIMLE